MSIRYTPHSGDPDPNLLGAPPPGTAFKSSDDAAPVDDTTAALSNLFNPYGGELDLSIDPSLGGPDAAVGAPAPTLADPVPERAAADAQVDSEATDAEPADDGAAPAVPAKRKATSRINMLARGAACEFCKRRKLKCSAEEPACASCLRAGIPCEYKQTKQRSRVRVLEDRLVELERRLGQQGQAGDASDSLAGSGAAAYISPAQTDVSSAGAVNSAAGFGGEDALFGLDSASSTFDKQEPDLMTLAAAAEADGPSGSGGYAWDGLAAQNIADELVKAASGGRGVGDKIIAHILHLYATQRTPALAPVHAFLSPETSTALFTSRTSPPHPSLLLALAALVLPLSPSRTLAAATLHDPLISASRVLAQQAFAALEPRLVDVVMAAFIRAFASYTQSRFVDGWNETSGAAGLAWAAGLGKLGHVGDAWLAPCPGRAERVAVERRQRLVMRKAQIIPPASGPKEDQQRINLFWAVYLVDRVGSTGWGWPCSIATEEITTPLPVDGDSPPGLSGKTLTEFMAGGASTASTDSLLCATLKSVTLMYEASRERVPKLFELIHDYATGWRPFEPATAEAAVALGPVNTVWILLRLARFLVHAANWANAAPHTDSLALAMADAELGSATAAAERVVACVERATRAGDAELDGYDTVAAAAWHALGRACFQLAADVADTDGAKAARLLTVGRAAQHALAVHGKKTPFSATHAQLLLNVSLGDEAKVGSWLRGDNVGA